LDLLAEQELPARPYSVEQIGFGVIQLDDP
jgi:hypothetical protein